MPRFFLSDGGPVDGAIVLTGQQASHARVLRLRPGDAVAVCDGAGTDYDCTVAELTSDRLVLTVRGCAPSASEPRLRASVYMAFAKSDKLEHVIQKATELAPGRLWPFPPLAVSPGPMTGAWSKSWSDGRKSPHRRRNRAAAAGFPPSGPFPPLPRL